MNVSSVITAPGIFATRSGRDAANLVATIESASRTTGNFEDRDARIRVATTEIANAKGESSKALTKALNELYTKNTGKSSPFGNSAQFVDYVEQVEKSRDKAEFIEGIGESGKVVLETLSTHNNYRRSRSAITDLLLAFPETPASAPAKNQGYQTHPLQSEAKRSSAPRQRAASFDTDADIRDVQNGFGMAYPVGEGYQPANQPAEASTGLRPETQAKLDQLDRLNQARIQSQNVTRKERALDDMDSKVEHDMQMREVTQNQSDLFDRITRNTNVAITDAIRTGQFEHEADILQQLRQADLDAASKRAENNAAKLAAANKLRK